METPGLCSVRAELPGQLGTRAHVELAVDQRQRRFDRSFGDDKCRGHFTVLLTLSDEQRDSALARRQLVTESAASADPVRLAAGLVGPGAGARSRGTPLGLWPAKPAIRGYLPAVSSATAKGAIAG